MTFLSNLKISQHEAQKERDIIICDARVDYAGKSGACVVPPEMTIFKDASASCIV